MTSLLRRVSTGWQLYTVGCNFHMLEYIYKKMFKISLFLLLVHRLFVSPGHQQSVVDYIQDKRILVFPLQWRHNEHDCVSNHLRHDCLLNRLFKRRSKKTSKLRVTGLCAGNSPGPVNSPHKGPVRRKMFPFDDVIMHEKNNNYPYMGYSSAERW